MRVAPSPLKVQLRRQLRAARRALPLAEHRLRSRSAALNVLSLPGFAYGKRVALYLPFDGETDTRFLIDAARRRGVRLYLPVIINQRHGSMRFVPFAGALRSGHFGIRVPKSSSHPLGARWFDLIVLPMVGIDAAGHRLGMGAGFYDRALAYRRTRKLTWGPRLVGLAFDVQRTEDCFAQPWDIRLDYLAAESGLQRFNSEAGLR
jgi:5-formyltetrahydrofolate cyclo-ligase